MLFRSTPDVAGSWQWIGTKTLRFDAKSDAVDRLPMATDFTVDIPAGTKSATGGVLETAASFQFSTPAADVRTLAPTGDDLALTPIFVATFDQLVDAQAVLPTIVVRADGQQRAVRLATNAEIDADDTARQIVANAGASYRFQMPMPTEIGTLVRHVGDRFNSDANSVKLLAYTVSDAYAFVDIQKTRLTFRVRNITDKKYAIWGDPFYPDQILLGAPRSYEISAAIKF